VLETDGFCTEEHATPLAFHQKDKTTCCRLKSVCWILCKMGKDMEPKRKGRPSLESQASSSNSQVCRTPLRCSQEDTRKDKVEHWPKVGKDRQRYKNFGCEGKTVMFCSKCQVHLCLNKHKNCFILYQQLRHWEIFIVSKTLICFCVKDFDLF